MNKKFYITTTLPYVNAEPHIGFALEIVQADTIARYKRVQGFDVFFNFGTDEHGLKIYRKAIEEKKDPQKYCDEYASKFDALKEGLNLSYNNFIRTTDQHHIEASQEFWRRCLKNGDIYKKNYRIKYCVGCELEKTDSELDHGKCLLHPNQKLEIYDEENYFFRFSKYQNKLLELYEKNPDFVVPNFRLKEIKTFIRNGLEDFSVSRLKSKMPWGIDVPDDPEHVIYVWFDALINYVSAIGWPKDLNKFKSWWPVSQFAGKDNLRQQSAIWQAMLMSAKLPPSKQIFIHGFITVGGQKISKSLGNVINPLELAKKYGTDAVRYYLLAKIHPWEDSDFTIKKFEEVFNADLANGLGNLVARVAKLCDTSGYVHELTSIPRKLKKPVSTSLEKFNFDKALGYIWSSDIKWGLKWLDKYINESKPWQIKDKKLLYLKLHLYVENILDIAYNLQPFLPATAEKILEQFKGPKVKSQPPLFPRIP
jgi:methionyl-tRNA synthetase